MASLFCSIEGGAASATGPIAASWTGRCGGSGIMIAAAATVANSAGRRGGSGASTACSSGSAGFAAAGAGVSAVSRLLASTGFASAALTPRWSAEPRSA
ncbi:hypothetical protein MET9862_05736 [Methylobacterium symbioticum]|uniref:Uncharacterized protein n=1 Tax=Methylobacterium symbioticum TaxID=2584084 RepID=A0A509EN41_9HYPH|nr:hypothetical protein MET9862_05736 [Methylobacterium symbioticum]